MNHLIDEVCNCTYCTKITIMHGDPLLNKWEKKFVESVSEQGWQGDYSKKQKAVIDKTFSKMRRIRGIDEEEN